MSSVFPWPSLDSWRTLSKDPEESRRLGQQLVQGPRLIPWQRQCMCHPSKWVLRRAACHILTYQLMEAATHLTAGKPSKMPCSCIICSRRCRRRAHRNENTMSAKQSPGRVPKRFCMHLAAGRHENVCRCAALVRPFEDAVRDLLAPLPADPQGVDVENGETWPKVQALANRSYGFIVRGTSESQLTHYAIKRFGQIQEQKTHTLVLSKACSKI